MFRDIYDIFYAAAMCFIVGSSMFEGLRAMERVDIVSDRQAQPLSTLPITSDFPYFLGSRISHDPAEWAKALDNVSPTVSYLVLNKDHEDLSVAYEAIRRISDYSFGEFVSFCTSKYCNTTCKEFIVNFFKLMLVVLQKLPKEDNTIEVSRDFKEFLDGTLPKRDCIISPCDSALFKRVASVLDDFE